MIMIIIILTCRAFYLYIYLSMYKQTRKTNDYQRSCLSEDKRKQPTHLHILYVCNGYII